MSPRQLIVTADDFGYGVVRDNGILDSFSNGLVTRTTLLVNGRSAESAARKALQAGLPMGLHINVTEGAPLAKPVPKSLVGFNECFIGPSGLADLAQRGLLCSEDLLREVEAQICKFKDLTGYLPVHVDGHNHAHVLEPVATAVAIMMQQYQLREVRVPSELFFQSDFFDALPPGKEEFYRNVSRDAQASYENIFKTRGIRRSSDAFVGMALMGQYLTEQNLVDAVLAVPSTMRSIELMVHPGVCCTGIKDTEEGCWPLGPDEFSQSPERESELTLLKSEQLRQVLENDLQLNLCSVSSDASCLAAMLTSDLAGSRRTTQCIAILTVTTLGTGNLTTARRIASILEQTGCSTLFINVKACKDVNMVLPLLKQAQVTTVIGINAKRVGHLTQPLHENHSYNVLIVTGGTDVNVSMKKGDDSVEDRSLNASFVVESFRKSSAVVSFSPEMAKELREYDRMPQIHIIPQGVDCKNMIRSINESRKISRWSVRKACGLPKTSQVVLLICGLRRVKAPTYLREVWSLVRKLHPLAHLVIVGPSLDQAVYSEIKAWVQETTDSSVVYHSEVPHTSIMQAIQDADVLINSSESEGMSGAILEAMAIGTPVIARAIEGNLRLIKHEYSGLVFHSPSEFVTQVTRILSDHTMEFRKRLIAQAMNFIQRNHGIDVEREAYMELVNNLQ